MGLAASEPGTEAEEGASLVRLGQTVKHGTDQVPEGFCRVSIAEEEAGVLVHLRGVPADHVSEVGSEDGVIKLSVQHFWPRNAGLANNSHRFPSHCGALLGHGCWPARTGTGAGRSASAGGASGRRPPGCRAYPYSGGREGSFLRAQETMTHSAPCAASHAPGARYGNHFGEGVRRAFPFSHRERLYPPAHQCGKCRREAPARQSGRAAMGRAWRARACAAWLPWHIRSCRTGRALQPGPLLQIECPPVRGDVRRATWRPYGA